MSSRLFPGGLLRRLLREVVGPPHLELPRRQLLHALLLAWPLAALGTRRPGEGQAAPECARRKGPAEPCLWIGHRWIEGPSSPADERRDKTQDLRAVGLNRKKQEK